MARDRIDEAERARDAAVLARIQAGDAEAFDQLFCDQYPVMVRFAVTMGYAREVAEDAASDVFEAVWRGRATWTVGRATIRSYLLTAVRNRIFKVARHAHVEAAHVTSMTQDGKEDASTAMDALEHQEIRQRLVTAIRELSERRRAALHLRFVVGLTYREVGEVLRISARSADELIERALITLRRALDGSP